MNDWQGGRDEMFATETNKKNGTGQKNGNKLKQLIRNAWLDQMKSSCCVAAIYLLKYIYITYIP